MPPEGERAIHPGAYQARIDKICADERQRFDGSSQNLDPELNASRELHTVVVRPKVLWPQGNERLRSRRDLGRLRDRFRGSAYFETFP